MNFKLIILFTFLSNIVLCQEQYSGNIIDALTNEPIEDVNIRIEYSNVGASTDADGNFDLKIAGFPATLILSHVAYEEEQMVLNSRLDFTQTIFLLPKTNQLDEVTVVPQSQLQLLSDPKSYSIQDFEILDGTIYRLEFHGGMNNYSVSTINQEGTQESILKLDNLKGVESLYKSCIDNIYVVAKNQAYQIDRGDENKLSLGAKIQRDTFENFIKPCAIQNGKDLYYLNKRYNGMMTIVSSYNFETKSQADLRVIADKELVDMYKGDAKYICESQNISNIQTNNTCENARLRNVQEDGDFLLQIFYKPEYPVNMGNSGNKILVYNHPEKKIEFYKDQIFHSEVEINYVHDKQWLKEIRLDHSLEKAYGIFTSKNGIGIKEIDLETGSTALVGVLETAIQHYKKIKIEDGIIYFLKNSNLNDSVLELHKYEI